MIPFLFILYNSWFEMLALMYSLAILTALLIDEQVEVIVQKWCFSNTGSPW